MFSHVFFEKLEYFAYLILCFAGHVSVLNQHAPRVDELVHLHLVTDSNQFVPASDKLTDGFNTLHAKYGKFIH